MLLYEDLPNTLFLLFSLLLFIHYGSLRKQKYKLYSASQKNCMFTAVNEDFNKLRHNI